MAYRSSARWLAPLALLGSLAAILIVISASDGGTSSDTSGSASTQITGSTETAGETTAGTATTTTTTGSSRRRFYVVKDGDVLSAIADKTGVPLEEIEQLNPDVDAQTLHAGQRIKLRP
jgi:LysM repeat protein